jgi:mycofactocin precursor
MDHATAEVSAPTSEPAPPAPVADDDLTVEEELLVEEISIDGMCGVY